MASLYASVHTRKKNENFLITRSLLIGARQVVLLENVKVADESDIARLFEGMSVATVHC